MNDLTIIAKRIGLNARGTVSYGIGEQIITIGQIQEWERLTGYRVNRRRVGARASFHSGEISLTFPNREEKLLFELRFDIG